MVTGVVQRYKTCFSYSRYIPDYSRVPSSSPATRNRVPVGIYFRMLLSLEGTRRSWIISSCYCAARRFDRSGTCVPLVLFSLIGEWGELRNGQQCPQECCTSNVIRLSKYHIPGPQNQRPKRISSADCLKNTILVCSYVVFLQDRISQFRYTHKKRGHRLTVLNAKLAPSFPATTFSCQ